MRTVSIICLIAVSAAVMPPPAKVVPFTQTFFGTVRSDPYHWMENGGADLTKYLDQQSAYTQSILSTNPGRQRVVKALREADAEASGARRQRAQSG
jgi:protease II